VPLSPETEAAKARAFVIRREKRIDEIRALVAEMQTTSPTLLAKRLRITRQTAAARLKEAGIAVIATGPNAQPGENPNALEAADEGKVLGLSILELFDTLQPFFRTVEDEKEAEDGSSLTTERDPRETWIAWRVFLAAAFGLECPEEFADCPYPGVPEELGITRGAANLRAGMTCREIYEACTGRSEWPSAQAKIVSLIVGRRGGKSYITAIIGIYLACCKSYTLNLGTKGMVMILARDREQAGVIRGYILAFMQKVPALARMLKGEPTQKLIELTNGITIEVRAVSESGTRGYTVVGALMDEIAFWATDTESAKQDKKILRAIKPAMFGIRGAMIVMLSSPYAKRGELYEHHRRGYGNNESKRVFVWQADTLSMRPEQDPELLEEIAESYEEDAESAKAEYGAQFRSDLESIFSKEAVEACSVDGRFERPYVASLGPYRAFVDPSGNSSDSYVVAIAHDEEREYELNGKKERATIPVLDKVVEFVPKFDPEGVSAEVAALAKSYRISCVTGDAYGGDWPRDAIKRRGVDYKLSEKNRSELYLEMLPLVNSGRCELLDKVKHKKAINQFSNLERRTGRGRDVVDHPSGSHDDVANAIAGVLVTGTVSQYRIRRPDIRR
jgi:hypothetical protein